MNLEPNFFTLLGIPQQFFVDSELLKSQFRKLQRQYHPDRYVNATPQEQRLAAQLSAHLNTAYATLDNAVKRASHMLELINVESDNSSTTIKDTGFLMEQMELREAVANARADNNQAALVALLGDVDEKYCQCQQLFADTYASINTDALAGHEVTETSCLLDQLAKMQFFEKVHSELQPLVRPGTASGK